MSDVINEQVEIKEEVTTDTPTPVEEEKAPFVSKPEKEELSKLFVEVFSTCYEEIDKVLEGKALRTKFEQIENSLRKYRRKEEELIKVVETKADLAKIAYEEAAKKFEQQALEELDPTKYETDVAPVEAEYVSLKRYYESKIKHLQSIKALTTKMFAREKSLIPSIKHAQAMLMSLMILRGYLMKGELEIVNADKPESVEKIKAAVENIFKHKALLGDFADRMPSLEEFTAYFNEITECSVDKSATRAKEGKEASFEMLNSICKELGIEVPEPDMSADIDPREVELIKVQNQLKVLEEGIRKNKVKQADGTYKDVPKAMLPKIMECLRASSLFLNGDIMSLMDEKTIAEMPFRTTGLSVFYNTCLPGVATQLYKDMNTEERPVPEYLWKMSVSWLFISCCVIDTIPTILLML